MIGKHGKSQIATLAERTSRFVLLIALPNGRTAEVVADALAAHITTLSRSTTSPSTGGWCGPAR